MRRLIQLDSLRGLAALSVLIRHHILASWSPNGPLQDALLRSPLRALITGRPAVMFFFVLSGFVLTRALRRVPLPWTVDGYARWVLQRTVRLCLPALATLAFSAGLYALAYSGTWPDEASWLAGVWSRPPTTSFIAEQALLLAPDGDYSMDGVLWSLVHEWRIGLVLPIVASAAVLRGRSGAVLLVLVGIAVSSVVGGRWGESLMLGPTIVGSLRPTLYFLLPFLIGAALETGDIAEVSAGRGHVAAAFLAVVGLAGVGTDHATLMASALLIWLALRPGPIQGALKHPLLAWLGTVSFSLYLVHLPVLAFCFHTLHGRLPVAAICALSIAAAFPAAHAFYAFVEQPAQRLARLAGQGGRLAMLRPAPN